jgi:L-arabinose isomerase
MAITRPAGTRTRARIGLVSGGLGAYWPQFPDLLPQLEGSAAVVKARLEALDVDVIDVGFVSDAQEGAQVAQQLRSQRCDLIVFYLATYLTASMIAPIAQQAGCPVLVINLQPSEAMGHETTDTGAWLAYCGACPVPEIGNVFMRFGVPFRSVSGHLHDDRAWKRIERWVRAASVVTGLRQARHGLMGHLYPGMLDVSTDLTMVTSHFGSHVEVLEFDDLRVRIPDPTDSAVRERIEETRQLFTIDETVEPHDLDWAAQVSVGLDRLVADFDLDSLAYYHRGLDGEQHERIGAGMILGGSLLTARGIPAAGEYELRTAIAMSITDRLGAGGSFTELQALNFRDGVVEMGHDGPAHLSISDQRPTLRGLGLYHGKHGSGVSVEFDVRHGPVTLVGLAQNRKGEYRLVTAEGETTAGPLLAIGNTTSRVNFDRDPGEWVDAWASTGIGHHWSLAVGHIADQIVAVGSLLQIDSVDVHNVEIV